MRKLRIAMFMSSNPIQAGGVQEHILYLSKELRKNGHLVHIYGPKPMKNIYSFYTPMGEKIYFPLPNGNHSNVHMLSEMDKPENVFVQSKYDIVHMHEPYIPFAAWSVLEKSSIPTIGTFHTAWDNDSIFNMFKPFIPLFKTNFSSHTHGAIFVSKITFENWTSLCDKKMIKKIISNAADTASFIPKEGINDIPHILFAARLVRRKGVLHLLKAVKILKSRKRKFTVTIIGNGDEREATLSFIKSHKLKSHVDYLGEIIGAERFKYFTEADIFCAPYINEAAPLAILEAISAGLPIVGFKNDSFKEGLVDYPAKDLLVMSNGFALADALESLIMDKDRIESIKKWCLTQRNIYSWSNIARQTEDVYYQVIQKYEKNK